MSDVIEIWRFTDGKRGHENQSRGLVEALGRITRVRCRDWAAGDLKAPFWSYVTASFPRQSGDPLPDLVVGAGSRTHWPMLAAKRSTGAAAIAIMCPPRLMRNLFDLCLVPQVHGTGGANMVATRGAITAVQPGGVHADDRGLILIGGPSRHYGWDEASTVGAVQTLVRTERQRRWRLTTSRRTPESTSKCLLGLREPNLEICPGEATDEAWVPTELALSGVVWTTEDSVSMVYECLTSGACVGLLPVPRRGRARGVARNIDELIAQHWCTSFDAWRQGAALSRPPEQMDEASRCARIVFERFRLGGDTARG